MFTGRRIFAMMSEEPGFVAPKVDDGNRVAFDEWSLKAFAIAGSFDPLSKNFVSVFADLTR